MEEKRINSVDESSENELKEILQRAMTLRYKNPQQALADATAIQRKAKELGQKSAEASALLLIGSCSLILGNLKDARDFAEQAREAFRQAKSQGGEASALSLLGNIDLESGSCDGAIEHYFKSLSIFEKLSDAEGAAIALNNIGLTHFRLENDEKAKEYLSKALALRRANHLRQGEAYTLNNLASIYEREGNFAGALDALNQSLALMRSLNDKRGEAAALCNCARIHRKLNRCDVAIKLQQESLTIERELKNRAGESESLYELGLIFSDLNYEGNDVEKAIDCFNDALELAQEVNARELQRDIHLALSELHAKRRSFEQAFEHHRKFHDLKESIAGEAARNRVQALEARNAEREYEEKLARFKSRAEQLEQLNHSLTKAIELKTQLIGIVTHDLNNPLQAILGYAELIKHKPDSPEQVVKRATMIESAATQLQERVDRWLKAASEESARLSAQKKSTHVNALLKQVIETMRLVAQKKSQNIVFVERDEAIACIDAAQIEEAIENLLSNAIKYSPIGKTITVTARRSQTHCVVSIKDEGDGLSEDDKRKLFVKFQTLSAKPTMGERSTGLGLYIVKQIIELHHGNIWAESEGKGKGTTFHIELPLAQ